MKVIEVAGGRPLEGREGFVEWGPWKLPLEDHLAMLWAGQQASMRLLQQTPGWDDPDNRLDVLFGARVDMIELDDFRARHGIDGDLGLTRCEQLLGRHWDVVLDLAERVVDEGRIDGSVVTRQYAKALNISRP